jgi:hypothetical protein
MTMATAAQAHIEVDSASVREAAAPRVDEAQAATSEEAQLSLCAGLSNDYLNHYSEALMLIEMAGDDPDIANELVAWHPVSYRSYFGASELRRASAALAAYDALPADRRAAFERLVASMDGLVTMAIFALQPPCEAADAAPVVDETAPALRDLIAQAAAFLNSGGQELGGEGHAGESQAVIDRIIGQAASREA